MNKIEQLIKDAMLAQNKDARDAYRCVKSKMLIEVTKKGAKQTMEDEELFINMVRKEVLEREEANSFMKDKEQQMYRDNVAIISLLSAHLPKMLSAEEQRQAVQAAIRDSGAGGVKDMGKVMGFLTANYKGKIDMGTASGMVKEELQKLA